MHEGEQLSVTGMLLGCVYERYMCFKEDEEGGRGTLYQAVTHGRGAKNLSLTC